MKKLLFFVGILTVIGVSAFADSFYGMGGYYQPSGNSDIYDQNVRETTFHVNDLNGWGGIVGYDHFLGEHINVGASVSGFSKGTDVEDVDFEFTDGRPILRHIHLEVVPMELNFHVLPAGRDLGLIPYVGGGVGVYYWQYEEIGDFVFNRFSANPTIISGHSYSDGWDPGWHVEGGIAIPVSSSATIMGEYRYWEAHGDLNTANFDPNFEPLDISGSSVTFGFGYWF